MGKFDCLSCKQVRHVEDGPHPREDRCWYCGQLVIQPEDRCPSCEGTGQPAICGDDYEYCPTCAGTGKAAPLLAKAKGRR
jgi:predicted amidophosphoribosyltransferase